MIVTLTKLDLKEDVKLFQHLSVEGDQESVADVDGFSGSASLHKG
jgi:hypothetical protein